MERRADEIEWRDKVNAMLGNLSARMSDLEMHVNKRLDDAEQHVSSNLAGLRTDINANTALTKDARTDAAAARAEIAAHREASAPVLEAVQTMQAGVRFLGKVGDGLAAIGRWVKAALKYWAPIAAACATVWLALRQERQILGQAWDWIRSWWPR